MTNNVMTREVDLDTLAKYHHEETVLRFTSNFDVTYEESLELFQEMKLFLALMVRYPKGHVFAVEAIYVLDEMWHTFLMFTKDYQQFCIDHFGFMIHHEPMKRAEKEHNQKILAENKEAAEKVLKPGVENLYSMIYDFYGNEKLIQWIRGYGEKYTIEYINKIRKPISV